MYPCYNERVGLPGCSAGCGFSSTAEVSLSAGGSAALVGGVSKVLVVSTSSALMGGVSMVTVGGVSSEVVAAVSMVFVGAISSASMVIVGGVTISWVEETGTVPLRATCRCMRVHSQVT